MPMKQIMVDAADHTFQCRTIEMIFLVLILRQDLGSHPIVTPRACNHGFFPLRLWYTNITLNDNLKSTASLSVVTVAYHDRLPLKTAGGIAVVHSSKIV